MCAAHGLPSSTRFKEDLARKTNTQLYCSSSLLFHLQIMVNQQARSTLQMPPRSIFFIVKSDLEENRHWRWRSYRIVPSNQINEAASEGH